MFGQTRKYLLIKPKCVWEETGGLIRVWVECARSAAHIDRYVFLQDLVKLDGVRYLKCEFVSFLGEQAYVQCRTPRGYYEFYIPTISLGDECVWSDS